MANMPYAMQIDARDCLVFMNSFTPVVGAKNGYSENGVIGKRAAQCRIARRVDGG